MLIRKLRNRILIMVFVIYIPFCYIKDCINKDYFDISAQEKVCTYVNIYIYEINFSKLFHIFIHFEAEYCKLS